MAEKLEQECIALIDLPNDKILQKKASVQKQSSERKKKPVAPREMTLLEQNELAQSIKQLQGQDLMGLWNIVQTHTGMTIDDSKEFSIRELPSHVARELQKYVRSRLAVNAPKPRPSSERPAFPTLEAAKPKVPLLRPDYVQIKPIQEVPIVSQTKIMNQESDNSSFISGLDSE